MIYRIVIKRVIYTSTEFSVCYNIHNSVQQWKLDELDLNNDNMHEDLTVTNALYLLYRHL